MKKTIETHWQGQKTFESHIGEHKITMDTIAENGGRNEGPSPLPLLMASYAGCMGIDTISILTKKRVQVEEFKVITEGTFNDEYPRYYKEIEATFQFKGKDLPYDVIADAIKQAETKYCGISATLIKAVKINIKINLINS